MKFLTKVILCCLAWTGIAHADIYDVPGIPISAEMASAQQARTVAITAGETDAFWQLMKKMLLAEDVDRVSIPDSDTLVNMVQNVSLSNEKTTTTKYMATLSVRFHPQKIQDFLTMRQIPFLTEEFPVSVVIPIWKTADDTLFILEENNPFFSYLTDEQTQLPENIVVPTGDLEDMTQARRIMAGPDEEAAEFFKNKYGADRIWIAQMQANACGGQMKTNLTKEKIGSGCFDVHHWIENLWKDAITQLEKSWRDAHTNTLEIPESYWVQVPVKNLNNWATIQKKLSKASFLTGIDVRGFRPNEVLVSLGYQGTLYDLKDHLNTINFNLTPGDSGVWVLTEIQK